MSQAACPRWEKSLIRAVACPLRLVFALCLPKAAPVRVINSSRSAAAVGTGARHTRFISTLFPLRGCDWNGWVRTFRPSVRSFRCTPQKIGERSNQAPVSLLHNCIESWHGHKVGLVLRLKCFSIVLRFKIAPQKCHSMGRV